jgi:nitrogen fixation protein FixH
MSELKSRHVLFMLLAFFGITIAVNITMATYALTTFSGEDVSDPYLKGLAFNKTLAAHSAQGRLGWTATIDVRGAGKTATTIEVSLRDRESRALNGLTVEATLRRPTDASLDRTVAFTADGEGRYAATVAGLARGQWDVVARVKGDGTSFEALRRVVLQ